MPISRQMLYGSYSRPHYIGNPYCYKLTFECLNDDSLLSHRLHFGELAAVICRSLFTGISLSILDLWFIVLTWS